MIRSAWKCLKILLYLIFPYNIYDIFIWKIWRCYSQAKSNKVFLFIKSLYKFPNVINQSREGSGPVGRELTTIYNGVTDKWVQWVITFQKPSTKFNSCFFCGRFYYWLAILNGAVLKTHQFQYPDTKLFHDITNFHLDSTKWKKSGK